MRDNIIVFAYSKRHFLISQIPDLTEMIMKCFEHFIMQTFLIFIYLYIYIYMYVCVCVCVCVCVYLYMHIYIYVCVCVCV